MHEVRFDRMVPAAIVARRKACNLAYLPVGSLEWHGSHMPFGTDYLTVTHLAEEAARRFGGVVFPPIYYGDVRYILQECRAEWRQTYIREMEVPEGYVSAFPLQNADGSPGAECPTQPNEGPLADEPIGFSFPEQTRYFAHFIARTLLSIHLYGFRNIVLLPGHGPNPAFCRKAEEVYRQNVLRRNAFGPPAKTMTWFYIEAAKELEPLLKNHWIHADKWEGSITMAAEDRAWIVGMHFAFISMAWPVFMAMQNGGVRTKSHIRIFGAPVVSRNNQDAVNTGLRFCRKGNQPEGQQIEAFF